MKKKYSLLFSILFVCAHAHRGPRAPPRRAAAGRDRRRHRSGARRDGQSFDALLAQRFRSLAQIALDLWRSRGLPRTRAAGAAGPEPTGGLPALPVPRSASASKSGHLRDCRRDPASRQRGRGAASSGGTALAVG